MDPVRPADQVSAKTFTAIDGNTATECSHSPSPQQLVPSAPPALHVKHEDDDQDDFGDSEDNLDGDTEEFRSRPQLPHCVPLMRPLQYLMSECRSRLLGSRRLIQNEDALEAGSIDINPEYQREVVWTGK